MASVAMNRNMFETVLKELLLEGTEHCVEVYEGTGATWRVVECGTCEGDRGGLGGRERWQGVRDRALRGGKRGDGCDVEGGQVSVGVCVKGVQGRGTGWVNELLLEGTEHCLAVGGRAVVFLHPTPSPPPHRHTGPPVLGGWGSWRRSCSVTARVTCLSSWQLHSASWRGSARCVGGGSVGRNEVWEWV